MRQNLAILMPALAAFYSAATLGAPVDNAISGSTGASPNPESTPAVPVESIANADNSAAPTSTTSRDRHFEPPFIPIPAIPGLP
ncbi:hypothetical protein HK102_005577, partial [Quaeritorhiza haematococci]